MPDNSVWYLLLGFPQVVITLPIILGCTIGAIAIVASFTYKAHRDRHLMSLKRSMVEQGMSADEIERVLAADPDKTPQEYSPLEHR